MREKTMALLEIENDELRRQLAELERMRGEYAIAGLEALQLASAVRRFGLMLQGLVTSPTDQNL